MAYSTCDTSVLRDAILRMWTPVVGARSFNEVIVGNAHKINAVFGQSYFGRVMVMDNLPFRPIFPCWEDYSDKQPPFEIEKEILSGSWSEGLYFYGHSNLKIPDMDYMLVLKNISFSEGDQLSGKLTLREDTPFVHAYITDKNAVALWNDFFADQEDVHGKRLSSRKLKERLNQNHNKLFSCFGDANSNDVDDGAAMYINRIAYYDPALKAAHHAFTKEYSSDMECKQYMLGEIEDFTRELITFTGWDIVLAISCEGWPSCAKEWITRDRIWPHDDLLHKITHDDGFHIVPKRSTEGDFRLSFSFAETTLIENLTELQHKVVRSFKAVVKYHQNTWSPNIKEIITTYHLKTIAFWHFERTIQDSITEQTVVIHLILLLQELAEALRTRELPMYFMPKVNLFENVENPEEAIDIAEKIEKLSHDFPLVVIAIENITSGFERHTSLFQNIIGNCNNFAYRRHRKGDQSAVPNPSKERMQELSTCFDTIQGLCKCLNPMTNMQFTPQHGRTVPGHAEGIAKPAGILAILQQFQFDTEELIDLE